MMYCPKCGLQNADETKFCRGCGAGLSNVFAAVDGKLPETLALSEKRIAVFSSGMRGLMIGVGLLIVSIAAFAASTNFTFVGLVFMALAFWRLGTGVSRLIQAKAIRSLVERDEHAALTSGQTEYIAPPRSIYETDGLTALPLSVTENTTTHLQMDPAAETFSLPRK